MEVLRSLLTMAVCCWSGSVMGKAIVDHRYTDMIGAVCLLLLVLLMNIGI